jgi:hypothetical protein
MFGLMEPLGGVEFGVSDGVDYWVFFPPLATLDMGTSGRGLGER